MYKLYKITNRVNGKLYIGITKLGLNQRWAKHLKDSQDPKYPLHRAIKKHGADSFSIELLKESTNRTYISDLEEPTILEYNSRGNGYNVAKGGYGGDLGTEANIKRKNTLASRPLSEKQRLADLQRQRQVGKTKENDAGRRAQAEKVKGNKFALGLAHSDETKKKMRESHLGKKRTAETRQRMSTSAIINHNGKRFSGRRASCLCCQKEWDIGNFTQHIKRSNNVI